MLNYTSLSSVCQTEQITIEQNGKIKIQLILRKLVTEPRHSVEVRISSKQKKDIFEIVNCGIC